jgi:hypothetical protein
VCLRVVPCDVISLDLMNIQSVACLYCQMSCCLALLSDAVVPDLVVRRSISVDLYRQKLTYTKVDLVLCSDKAG